MSLELYKRIRQRREQLGLSQEELAQKMGYKSRSSINKIETGENDIPQSKIVAFARALNTSPSYLMGWEEEAPPLNLSEDASIKYEKLVEMLGLFTDEEWNKLMEYAALLITARQNQKDEK